MKQKDKRMQKLGKAGADKRWASRHALIIELSKLVNKNDLNWIQGWPTAHLLRLLEAYQKNV